MLVVFLRAFILYIVVFFVIRLMGKRELSKVQPFELAIIILIADLASGPMASKGISMFDGIIPILALLVSYIIFTLLIQSNNKVQSVLCGNIAILIENGKINEEELKKQQYTVSDLMQQLREKEVFMVQDVKYAILENNGKLNIIKNSDNMENIPLDVIEDGEYVEHSLNVLNISKSEIEQILEKKNIKKENVLIGTMDQNSNFLYQLKEVQK